MKVELNYYELSIIFSLLVRHQNETGIEEIKQHIWDILQDLQDKEIDNFLKQGDDIISNLKEK